MKKLFFLCLLASWAVVSALPAHADTIVNIGSSASTANNTVNPTVDLTTLGSVNPGWATLPGGDWISIANTGDPSSAGFTILPNGPVATFSTTFNLDSAPSSASLFVLADDTTSVIVNGVTIFNASSGPFPTCSTPTIGCLNTSEGTFIDNGGMPGILNGGLLANLHAGLNTISFETLQGNGLSSGLAFAGTIDPPVSTPEPGTLTLLGLGIAVVMLTASFARPVAQPQS